MSTKARSAFGSFMVQAVAHCGMECKFKQLNVRAEKVFLTLRSLTTPGQVCLRISFIRGVRVLIDRYRSAGLAAIAHDFYSGGRHDMLHETNRRDVITNLLIWISGVLNEVDGCPVTGRR